MSGRFVVAIPYFRNGRTLGKWAVPPGWFIVLFVALGIGPVPGLAASGSWSIMGKVVSSQTGDPLPYANVALYQLSTAGDTVGTPSGGAMTMPDGTYRIAAAPGSYRLVVTYVSYRAQKSPVLQVQAGAPPVTMDLALVPDAIRIQGVQVSARVVRDSEIAVLARQRKAAAVSDGVSSQQISKTTDSNAAEVLQRVTGLSVVGGRYVFVRGLGERYSSTEINGAAIGTPEPNKRVVPLDLFPSGLLDNVVVQKTYTPDEPGEFGGGVVNITTRDFPGHRIADFSISSGLNGVTAGRTFVSYRGGRTDFLGFDDGTRALPDIVQRLAGSAKITSRSFITHHGFSADTVALLGRAFTKTWDPRSGKAFPALSLAGTYGNEVHLFDRPLGFLGSFSYSGNRQASSGVDNFYKSDGGLLSGETAYRTETSSTSILWGLLGNTSYRLTDFNTITLRAMYDRSAEDETRGYQGYNNDWTSTVRNTRFDYVERGLFAGSLSTSSFIPPLGGATLDLRFNYSSADRNEPDRREYTYQQDEVDGREIWALTTKGLDEGLTRMFGRMREDERGAEVSATFPFKSWSRLDSKLKTGLAYRNKNRHSTWRRFAYKTPSFNGAVLDSVLAQEPESFMTDELISGDVRNGFVITELTKQDTDNYRAHQEVSAQYLMADLALTTKLRTVLGARIEHATVRVASYDIFGQWPDSLLSKAHLNNRDLLPSINLTYNLSAESNLRAAYSSTISRPDFRELSNQSTYDFVGGYPEVGNPKLRRSRIHNWDLRFETYPGSNELVAVSAFYKKLVDPIERSIQGGSVATFMPINAHSGYLKGAEGEVRAGLGRFGSPLAPWAVTANYARVKSETDIVGFGVETTAHRPLQGQSTYVLNLGVYYASQKGRTSGAALYNVSGRRLASLGVYGLPDIYERPRNSLSLTATHALRHAKIKLSLENVLNSDVRFDQEQKGIPGIAAAGSRVTHSAHLGRSVALSISNSL